MGIFELFITAVALSMDAFAVAVCKGLSVSEMKPRHAIITGLYFGGFQALMPLIGYLLGSAFESFVSNVAPLIAFALLALIGINMIRESRSDTEKVDCSFCPRAMLPLAVATSIDALVVGIGFAMIPDTNIALAVTLIGVTTFILSAVGVKIGAIFGDKYKSKSELFGGIALICIGLKTLIEYLIGLFK